VFRLEGRSLTTPHRSPLVGRTLSLERKLPLLMTAVLVGVLALSLFLTYSTLTRSAEGAARDRLTRAARQVAGTVQAAVQDRLTQLRRVGRDTAVRSLLHGRPADSTRVAAALNSLRSSSDSGAGLAAEVWDPTGRRLAYVGANVTDGRPSLADAPFTPFYAADGRVYFWMLAPIEERGRVIGHVAAQRRVSGPREANQTLRDLIGEDVELYMRNAVGDVWSASPGDPAIGPSRRDTTASGIFNVRPRHGRTIVGEAAIAGTPWVTVLETPVTSVHAGTRTTLLTLTLLSLILIAGGAAISWAISRRVTRPLVSLTDAAEAIARGHPARYVEDGGSDEIGRLAASFNQMASEVAASRRELEQRIADIDQARAEAERASRAKSDFLAVMSHELRTPLNAIGGYAQLLELGVHGPINDAQRDALARLGRSQAHLLRLITDVLNFAKLDAGQVQYALSDVSIDQTLANVEPLIAPQVQTKGLTFTWQVCGDRSLAARADPDKLEQIMLNVLTNAIKFTPSGGQITAVCEATDDHVYIRVRDTGVGIPAERLPSVFEPFVQGERTLSRPHEGVGLGLAISRDLARGMGGDLTAMSEVGKGSVFTVWVPRGGQRTADGERSDNEAAANPTAASL
jgi:signal transduction histidine kinase